MDQKLELYLALPMVEYFLKVDQLVCMRGYWMVAARKEKEMGHEKERYLVYPLVDYLVENYLDFDLDLKSLDLQKESELLEQW